MFRPVKENNLKIRKDLLEKFGDISGSGAVATNHGLRRSLRDVILRGITSPSSRARWSRSRSRGRAPGAFGHYNPGAFSIFDYLGDDGTPYGAGEGSPGSGAGHGPAARH